MRPQDGARTREIDGRRPETETERAVVRGDARRRKRGFGGVQAGGVSTHPDLESSREGKLGRTTSCNHVFYTQAHTLTHNRLIPPDGVGRTNWNHLNTVDGKAETHPAAPPHPDENAENGRNSGEGANAKRMGNLSGTRAAPRGEARLHY